MCRFVKSRERKTGDLNHEDKKEKFWPNMIYERQEKKLSIICYEQWSTRDMEDYTSTRDILLQFASV